MTPKQELKAKFPHVDRVIDECFAVFESQIETIRHQKIGEAINAARSEALEEAARILDAEAEIDLESWRNPSELAAAIRALKS